MDTRTLLVLSAEYRAIIDATAGEVTPEVQVLETELMNKVDACYVVVEELKAAEQRWAQEEEFARNKKKAFAAARERLNKYVKEAIQFNGTIELTGEEYKAKLVRNGGIAKLELDEAKLPKEYWKQVITTEPDREMIRSTIEAGIPIEGASLSRGYSVKWQRNLRELT